MRKLITSSLLLGLLLVITSCSNAKKNKAENDISGLSDEEIVEIATKAYVYGYPLILMDLTRKVGTNVEAPGIKQSSAPINQFGHYREFPDHKLTDVVKPNVDTYYSTVFFDLSKEAFVLSVPATERYYLLPMLDAYTNVFASPGTRTTGTAAQDFLITKPFWEGEVPEGMTHIKSPTSLVWLLGRTQVNSKEDGATVVRVIQDGYKLVPLNFKIWDGWRPREVQLVLYMNFWATVEAQHPDWTDDQIRELVGTYVAIASDPKCIPNHSTGGSVDLTLVDVCGAELNMGTGFDHFGPEAAALYYEHLDGNEAVRNNRRLLRKSLTHADFRFDEDEWWHFDFGNQIWAMEFDKPIAIYSEVKKK